MEKFRVSVEATGLRGIIPDLPHQRLMKRTGVVLRRLAAGEGSLTALLFLRETGLLWVKLPGAAKGSVRFGGAVEPLVWGTYQLYQSHRTTWLKEVEVMEDCWALRSRPQAIRRALNWTSMLDRFLMKGYPYDDVLALFYWGLQALTRGEAPEAVTVRFLWRWLDCWGMAPDLRHCCRCGSPLEGAVFDGDGLACSRCTGTTAIEAPLWADYVEHPRYAVPEQLQSRKDATLLAQYLPRFFEGNR